LPLFINHTIYALIAAIILAAPGEGQGDGNASLALLVEQLGMLKEDDHTCYQVFAKAKFSIF
jgi:hypothetical protein